MMMMTLVLLFSKLNLDSHEVRAVECDKKFQAILLDKWRRLAVTTVLRVANQASDLSVRFWVSGYLRSGVHLRRH